MAGRRLHRGPLLVAIAMVLTACAGPGSAPADPGPGPTSASRADGSRLPSDHVHGVGFEPGGGELFLATHDGLFRYDASGPVRVGPVIDLMGFTVGPDRFYSSGHPGPDAGLPNPVGLIESTDGGETWEPLSRQGESDFHALTASGQGLLASDGVEALGSPDGRTWSRLEVPVDAFSVAAAPSGRTVLVTSPVGPARSADGGASWVVEESSPILQLVAFADDTRAVGVAPDGTVHTSADAGATWQEAGAVDGAPQALAARTTTGELSEIVVVTRDALMRSTDGGRSFAEL